MDEILVAIETVADVLGKNNLNIPDYQRPYKLSLSFIFFFIFCCAVGLHVDLLVRHHSFAFEPN